MTTKEQRALSYCVLVLPKCRTDQYVKSQSSGPRPSSTLTTRTGTLCLGSNTRVSFIVKRVGETSPRDPRLPPTHPLEAIRALLGRCAVFLAALFLSPFVRSPLLLTRFRSCGLTGLGSSTAPKKLRTVSGDDPLDRGVPLESSRSSLCVGDAMPEDASPCLGVASISDMSDGESSPSSCAITTASLGRPVSRGTRGLRTRAVERAGTASFVPMEGPSRPPSAGG
eukprot:CAMPEP_0206257908 /NCGR_PEP_ID=MMETSP0047_2-20121206/25613_1 /ASSEMBLY_ACC=CAM_ASM_000192 /TAXON_ID=195065 /ORGANISM="Chroomonas mesostigmatica_cf, Strain CCMP1168" /LENGTH=224 /DNA_ID=CAMNT_0053684569 /DNA_START=78 /DNA_END=752 /DNA_ORIENTATION=+